MKLSDSRGIKTAKWYPNEMLRNDDINSLGQMQYQNIVDTYGALLAGTPEGVSYSVGGLDVQWSTALTVVLKAGVGVSKTGSYLEANAWGFVSDSEKLFTVSVPEDALIGLTGGGTLDRIDTIQVRPVIIPYNNISRNFKDPVTGIVSSATVDIRNEYGYESMVLTGTEAVNPVAPATTAGWVKLAEVYVSAGYTEIAETSIVGYEYSSEWSTDTGSTKSIEKENEHTYYRGEATYDGLGFFNLGRHKLTAKFDSTHTAVVRDTGELFMMEFDGTDWTSVGKARLENRTGTDKFAFILECTSSEVIAITTPNYYIYRMTWEDNYFQIDPDSSQLIAPSVFMKFCGFSATEFVAMDDSADTVTMYKRIDGVQPFQPEGNVLTKAGLSMGAVCRLDATHIVLYDANTNDLSVYNWNGTDFLLIGSPITVPGGACTIHAINATTIVRGQNLTTNNITVFTWNGSSFTLTHTATIGSGGEAIFAGLGTDQITIGRLSGTFLHGTYSWSGSALSLVGNSVYIGGTANPQMEHMYGNYFSFYDIGSDEFRMLEYRDKSINQIGNALYAFDSAATPMARIDGHHIATTNRDTDTLDIYQWDGINWKKKTSLSLGVVTSSFLVALNSTDILVFNASVVQVYRWDKSASTLTTIGASMTTPNVSSCSKVKHSLNEAYSFTATHVYKYIWDSSASVLRRSSEETITHSSLGGLILDDRTLLSVKATSPFTEFYVREYHDEAFFRLNRVSDSINTRNQTTVMALLDDGMLVVAWNRSAYIHVFKIS